MSLLEWKQTSEYDYRLSDLLFWHPILKRIGMRVPETRIIYTDIDFEPRAYGEKVAGYDLFLEQISMEASKIGFPCFLRSGLRANKHSWKESCLLTSKEEIPSHVFNLIEVAALANIGGRAEPHSTWAIRKMIATNPKFYAFSGNMPIVREFRFFIKNHKIQCHHPYWPIDAFEGQPLSISFEEVKTSIDKISHLEQQDEVFQMAEYIAQHFDGYWSVDFLQDINNQWWCTDMALGDLSYHAKPCQHIDPI